MYRYVVSSPLGELTLLSEDGERLLALLFGCYEVKGEAECELLLRAGRELEEYFSGKRRTFDVPLFWEGSDFSHAVFSALCTRVPYGETVTYATLALLAGYPRAQRAVGNLLNRNPLPIFVPCHRVVGKTGVGNYFSGLEKKLYLMRLEGMDV